MSSNTHIPLEDRVPFWQKAAYGIGGPMDWLTVGIATSMLWIPVFNIGYGINPGILGLLLVLHRGWDAIADPLMGNISDNTRSRWGRRRPYILVGGLLTTILMPFLWRPPTQFGEIGILIYLGIFGILLFTSFTIWAMPYYSLMMEMTPNYDERTRVAAVRAFFTQFSILIGGWVMAAATSSYFANPETGEPDIANGMKTVSIYLSLIVIFMAVIPAIFVKERYYEKEARQQEKTKLLEGLKESLSIRPFWILIGVVFFQMFGLGVTGTLGLYVNMYYINEGEVAAASMIEGWKATASMIAGIFSVFFWTWVCERLDKKWALMIILGLGFIGAGLNLICLTPEYPYLQLVPTIFYAAVIGAVWMIVPSMVADVLDYDELKTGKRREGSVNSVFSWFLKIGMTAAAGLSGFVLHWTGFNVDLGNEQPEEVIQKMLMSFILIPIVFWFIAMLLTWIYPLTRGKMNEIRKELEERRGKV